jgi:hypothetical protein
MAGVNRRARDLGKSIWFSIVLILLLYSQVAGASATTPVRKIVLTPPYHGNINYQDLTDVQPCGVSNATAKLATSTEFNFKTGFGGVREESTAKSCASGLTVSGDAEGLFSLFLPIRHILGAPTVFLNGTYSMTGAIAFSGGSCSRVSAAIKSYSCVQSAHVYWFLSAFYDNLTSRGGTGLTLANADNSTYNDTYCRGNHCASYSSGVGGTVGAFSISGSFNSTISVGSYMSKTAQYAVEIDFYSYAQSECSGNNAFVTGCSTSALMNLATQGQGFHLNSIVVT